MKPLLEIKNLSVAFSGKKVVSGINLSLLHSKILAIVGESGSGKSVTSLSIMKLLSTSAQCDGEIIFSPNNSSVDLLKINENEMLKYRGNSIAMIFQEPMTSLNPVITCGKQVLEPLMLHKKMKYNEAKEMTLQLLEEVMLPNPFQIFSSYPYQLSGGQRQRVMIAMAMSCHPLLLIADEPTTALDVMVQKRILDLMINLQQKYNTAILFISHDLGVVANIAHQVAVMHKGIIVEQGDTKNILFNPQHPYTKGLLACRPPLTERPKRLLTVSDFLTNEINQSNNFNIPPTITLISNEKRKLKHNAIYNSKPILEVKNLKTYFLNKHGFLIKKKNDIKAVDDISFEVYSGETLGLVGESGCGKSTLGRTILQLISSTSGCIIYKGTALTSASASEIRRMRRKIQFVFQDPYSSLNPYLTIKEAIIEPMNVHSIGRNKIEREERAILLLQKVGLDKDILNRYPHEFSGGQRQRIVIARALAVEPEFLICDEPVSALDVSVQAQVLNLLNELKEFYNLTYIFISHDLSVVKYMSDRMMIMKKGKLVELGDADSIYANPKENYTKQLIDSILKINFNQ